MARQSARGYDWYLCSHCETCLETNLDFCIQNLQSVKFLILEGLWGGAVNAFETGKM